MLARMGTPIEYVDLETAKAARGLRIVTVSGVPSPWSEAAKGIFRTKKIPFVAVRLEPGDKEVRKWTRSSNAPAAMYDDEPARTGWAEILELAERLAPEPALVPKEVSERVRFHGLAHEIVGAGGLLWNARLHTIQTGIETDGTRGFPPFVGRYLGLRYGLTGVDVGSLKSRAVASLEFLAETLGDREYLLGDRFTAVDIYCAAALNMIDPLPEDLCPMVPLMRAIFESMKVDVTAPEVLLAHRRRIYERHLELPMVL